MSPANRMNLGFREPLCVAISQSQRYPGRCIFQGPPEEGWPQGEQTHLLGKPHAQGSLGDPAGLKCLPLHTPPPALDCTCFGSSSYPAVLSPSHSPPESLP